MNKSAFVTLFVVLLFTACSKEDPIAPENEAPVVKSEAAYSVLLDEDIAYADGLSHDQSSTRTQTGARGGIVVRPHRARTFAGCVWAHPPVDRGGLVRRRHALHVHQRGDVARISVLRLRPVRLSSRHELELLPRH